MAIPDIADALASLEQTLAGIEQVLDVPGMKAKAAALEADASAPDLWDDQANAQRITSQLSLVQGDIRRIEGLRRRLDDLVVLVELAESEDDADSWAEAERELDGLRRDISEMEVRTLLSGEYDAREALITIRSEAGGVDAADWAEMLLRLYTRYCERHGWPFEVYDIPEADIRIDVFRSSGPGGQSVNTTDSAVRITHLPTGIVVSCQNEKSQIQNRAAALRVLQSRLLEVRRREEREKMDALKGDSAGSWGTQMRSYVLHPYQMVKDLRTEHETGNTSAVLDGEIDDFIESGIRWRRQREMAS